jgi:hypothetical protein
MEMAATRKIGKMVMTKWRETIALLQQERLVRDFYRINLLVNLEDKKINFKHNYHGDRKC